MEKLNRLIQDASNQFECHNFHTALDLYVRCIKMCEMERFPLSIRNNLKSSEAAIRTILGQFEEALKVCNEVLETDKQHWLCLLRRSQVYKKQLKLKKAMKDLQMMGLYAPDNMQVAALKLEIRGLMSKPEGFSSSSQESEAQVDEEELLKFSNLKRIDRTSVSIMIPKNRQSRVTISGDSAFVYESTDSNEKRESLFYAPQFICQRYIQIDQQLQEAATNQPENDVTFLPVFKTKPSRGRSILKNRQSQLFVSENKDVSNDGMKLLQKIHNIDGKVISSQGTILSQSGEKEVGFRKSIFNEDIPENIQIIPSKKAPPKRGARKSCLKRTSFDIDNQQVQKVGRRNSKFDNMSRSSIDGKFIKSDKKKVEALKQSMKQNMGSNNNLSDDDSDVGSYNIFGSKRIEISRELRQNLGIGSEDIVSEEDPKKKERKRSILKKNSLLLPEKKKVSIFCKQQSQEEQQPCVPERKAKKSVMFMQ